MLHSENTNKRGLWIKMIVSQNKLADIKLYLPNWPSSSPSVESLSLMIRSISGGTKILSASGGSKSFPNNKSSLFCGEKSVIDEEAKEEEHPEVGDVSLRGLVPKKI